MSPSPTAAGATAGATAADALASNGLAPDLLARARGLQLRVQRLVTEAFAGDYASAFKGRGTEFDELAEYQPGDDVRAIDWNATARTGRPHIKRHRAERELTVMLLVDVSASTAFGSTRRSKRDAVAEAAALIATVAARSNDRVGLLHFSDRVETFLAPKKGRGHVWRVLREVLGCRPSGRATDLGAALEVLATRLRRRAVAFVLSDFQAGDFELALRLAARRHDLTAVIVGDERERSLPPIGLIELEDLETGERRRLDTGDARLAGELARGLEARRQRVASSLAAAGVGAVEISTAEDTLGALARHFRQRAPRPIGRTGPAGRHS